MKAIIAAFMKRNYTTIRVSRELRNRLAELGGKGDTFEIIIWRLLYEAGYVDTANAKVSGNPKPESARGKGVEKKWRLSSGVV